MDVEVRRTRKMDAPWNIATVGSSLSATTRRQFRHHTVLRTRLLYVS